MNIYRTLDKNYVQYGKIPIHVLLDNRGNFWFSGKDTAEALGYDEKNSAKSI